MSSAYPKPLQDIIEQFSSLPGIGPKSAQRIAFHLLHLPNGEAEEMMQLISTGLGEVQYCQQCFNFAIGDLCGICSSGSRDPYILCVVEDPRDVFRVESTGEFKGLYHVLGGAINSMDGVGPNHLHIDELVNRVKQEQVKEVIVATNPNSEGEYTALYIAKQLSEMDVEVTRPASGLPIGGELEYADDLTLGRAMKGRQNIDWE